MPLYVEKCWLLSDNHHYQTEFSLSISIILHNNFGHLTKKHRIFDRNRDYCNDGTLSNKPFWNDRHKTNEKFTNWSPVNKSTQIRWSSHTSTNWCVIWFFWILLLFMVPWKVLQKWNHTNINFHWTAFELITSRNLISLIKNHFSLLIFFFYIFASMCHNYTLEKLYSK